MKPMFDPSVAVCPEEQVIVTAFYSLQANEGGRSKATFVNKAGVFAKFDQVWEIMKWAERDLTDPRDRLLKIEVAQNAR